MKPSMIEGIAMIFVDFFLISQLIRWILSRISSKRSVLILLIAVVSALLIGAHVATFNTYVKEANYFDRFGVERAFASDKLNKKARQVLGQAHPDKNSSNDAEEFNRLTKMRNILMDPLFENLYDTFGEFVYPETQKPGDYANLKSALSLEAYINFFSFFSIVFIVSTVFSYESKFFKYRIISNLLILALFLNEGYMIFSAGSEIDQSKKVGKNPRFEVPRDEFDAVLPNLALFERITLFKMVLMAVLVSLRVYFDLTGKNTNNKFEDLLEQEIDSAYEIFSEDSRINGAVVAGAKVVRAKDSMLAENQEDAAVELDEKQKVSQTSKNSSSNELSGLLEKAEQAKSKCQRIRQLANEYNQSLPKDSVVKEKVKKVLQIGAVALFAYSAYAQIFKIDDEETEDIFAKYRE